MTSLALVRLFCAICDALERRLIPGSVQLAGAAWVALLNLPVSLGFGPPFWFRRPADQPWLVQLTTFRLWCPRWLYWMLRLPHRLVMDFVPVWFRIRNRIRLRLPGWCSRFLQWLRDFLIEAFVIVAGALVICGIFWFFVYA